MADQFQDALARFSAGLKEFRMGQVLNGANEQIQQIRASQIEETQKRQALQGIAQDLTFQLSGMGASPDQVQGLTQSFLGPKATPVQSAFQGLVAGLDPNDPTQAGKIKQISAKYIQDGADQKALLAQMQIQAAQGKERRNAYVGFTKQFNSLAKDVTKARNQAQGAVKLLDSGNPITPTAIGTLMARASGELGNLTEAERNMFAGAGDLISRVKRYYDTNTLSQLPESDRKALRTLAQQYAETAESAINEAGLTVTEQALGHQLMADEDPDILVRRITGGKVRAYQTIDQRGTAQAKPASTGGASSSFGGDEFFKPNTKKK
jgi:hypothetical protein